MKLWVRVMFPRTFLREEAPLLTRDTVAEVVRVITSRERLRSLLGTSRALKGMEKYIVEREDEEK